MSLDVKMRFEQLRDKHWDWKPEPPARCSSQGFECTIMAIKKIIKLFTFLRTSQ